jgi:hypothetical protein
MDEKNMPDEIHAVRLSLIKAEPLEADAGEEILLAIQVWCPKGCSLAGKKIKVIKEDHSAAKEIILARSRPGRIEAESIIIEAPLRPGSYTWQVFFPLQKEGNILHGESSIPFSFRVKPHATTMAVWDVPSPAALQSLIALKVGVKCLVGCRMAGTGVEIYDDKGERICLAMLGGTPWEGSEGLYWTEVMLPAPEKEGSFTWRAEYHQPDLAIPHRGTSSSFNFHVAQRPQYSVTVKVLDQESGTPIEKAYVRMNLYRAFTDETGTAKLEVPPGMYQISVFQNQYEIWETDVQVDKNTELKAELLSAIPVL